MFCPKCGTKNPDNGKFCRSCGADLAVVSAALSRDGRDLPVEVLRGDDKASRRLLRRTDPDEAWAVGIRQTISGIGFAVISIVLLLTNVAGGSAWWWALLFPAFTFLSTGVSYLARSRRLERNRANFAGQNAANQLYGNQGSLPAAQTEFVRPDSSYRTGDLAPPSVVESTTRLLSSDDEKETKVLN